jgi:SPP1 family predicted phage head-tail adaptor
MRNIVKVFAPSVSTDETGQETYSYKLYRKVFASYERDSFSKNETGFIQASGHEEITFKLRYDKSITYNHRMEFEGNTYRIIGLDNFMNLRHELRIKCVAVNL